VQNEELYRLLSSPRPYIIRSPPRPVSGHRDLRNVLLKPEYLMLTCSKGVVLLVSYDLRYSSTYETRSIELKTQNY